MNKPKSIDKKKAIAFAVLFWTIIGLSMAPASSAQPLDIHNINAQVYGNVTATDGFPAYLNSMSTSGKMPQSMWLVVRAPGNDSTFTLVLNGTIIIQNQAFDNIANYSFTTKDTGNTPIQITVHSSAMNLTRVFTYQGDIMTVTSFISYETALHPKPSPPSMPEWLSFLLIGSSSAAGVFSMILVAEYWRREKNSNPDMSDFLVGGQGGMR